MAEPSKEKSADQKKKSSFLDEDIGADFLNSWKLKDDRMDFSFDTGTKSKKKAFDFDKLDMDFNLDGDFNKISSFKMDMSDFDFSSPPKKDAKTKEINMSDLDLSSPPKRAAKTKEVDMSYLELSSPPKKAAKTREKSKEEPSGRSSQGKQDHVKFSFDFNELDCFDLDATLSRRDKSSKNRDSSKEVVPDAVGSERSKVDLAEDISNGVSEIVATSKIETVLVDPGNSNSMNDCASQSEKLPPGPRCQEKVICISIEESSQQSHLPEKEISTEPYAEQKTHDQPAELVGGIDSTGNAGVDKFNGGCPQIKKVNSISSEKEAVSDKMLIEDDPNHEDMPSKNPSLLDIGSLRGGGRSMSGSDTLAENDEPPKGDLDKGETLATLVPRKTPHEFKSTKGTQNSTSEFPLSTQASESTVDKVTQRKESGDGEHCLKTSKRSEGTGPQLYRPPLVGSKSLLAGNNKTGSMSLCPVIEKGVGVNTNDARHGSKLLATPVLVDKATKVRPTIPARDNSDSDGVPNGTKLVGKPQLCGKEVTEREPVVPSDRKILKDLREDSDSDGVPNGTKLVGKPQLCGKGVTEREPVLLSDQKILKDLRVQVSPPSSTENTRRLGSQSLKPKIMLPSVEPLRNTRILTADGNKPCPEKPAQKKTDMSIGGNKLSLNAAPQREVKSQRSSEQNKELEGNMETETRQIVDGSGKMPQNLPLKRKASENGLNPGLASFKPLKRLSPSPRETRNFTEPLKGTVEQVRTHENHLEIKTKSPSSRLGSPCLVNLMELQLPSAMETDENVEKAEAYTKELEHMCNMLRKKHEEAKEILVRAVVNNNNLLMLNHPIYEAKIHKVQKFAARLASKELQAC